MGRLDSSAERLASLNKEGRHLCVGLDTDATRIPRLLRPGAAVEERVVAFNEEIVARTADVACAYKPNAAFYEALGPAGFPALAGTVSAVKRHAPTIPIILDAKRADIGTTNLGYVTAAFEELAVDAITVHPYLGREALQPFLSRADKLIFVLARTSNPGAGEFQDLNVGPVPLYRHVARAVANHWNDAGNCGLVVGATYPEELALIRMDISPGVPILVPGVGAQGGDLRSVVDAHRRSGSSAFLVNASRSVLYASSSADFGEAAAAEATRLHDAIRAALVATD